MIKDIDGEIKMSFGKTYSHECWGKHYIPSLMNAHNK
jgi:hypothetical protein